MAEPFLASLKNVLPSLERATEVNFMLLLSSFVLTADCAALYTHGMNVLHLSDVPDVVKPRLAVEAVILVIEFGVLMGIVMPCITVLANGLVVNTVVPAWTRIQSRLDLDNSHHRPDPAYSVPVYALRKKAHETKESYYLNLLKEADEAEIEYRNKIWQTAQLALSTLILSGIDLYAPLSSDGRGIIAQIADALGQNGYLLLLIPGCVLLALAFYPLFEDRYPTAYCPELARELDEEWRKQLAE